MEMVNETFIIDSDQIRVIEFTPTIEDPDRSIDFVELRDITFECQLEVTKEGIEFFEDLVSLGLKP